MINGNHLASNRAETPLVRWEPPLTTSREGRKQWHITQNTPAVEPKTGEQAMVAHNPMREAKLAGGANEKPSQCCELLPCPFCGTKQYCPWPVAHTDDCPMTIVRTVELQTITKDEWNTRAQ